MLVIGKRKRYVGLQGGPKRDATCLIAHAHSLINLCG